MLVLARKKNQRVLIGDFVFTVTQIRGDVAECAVTDGSETVTWRMFENEEVALDQAGEILARVVSIDGDTVRLGFTAPKDIRIDREEVSIRRAKEAKRNVNRPVPGSRR